MIKLERGGQRINYDVNEITEGIPEGVQFIAKAMSTDGWLSATTDSATTITISASDNPNLGEDRAGYIAVIQAESAKEMDITVVQSGDFYTDSVVYVSGLTASGYGISADTNELSATCKASSNSAQMCWTEGIYRKYDADVISSTTYSSGVLDGSLSAHCEMFYFDQNPDSQNTKDRIFTLELEDTNGNSAVTYTIQQNKNTYTTAYTDVLDAKCALKRSEETYVDNLLIRSVSGTTNSEMTDDDGDHGPRRRVRCQDVPKIYLKFHPNIRYIWEVYNPDYIKTATLSNEVTLQYTRSLKGEDSYSSGAWTIMREYGTRYIGTCDPYDYEYGRRQLYATTYWNGVTVQGKYQHEPYVLCRLYSVNVHFGNHPSCAYTSTDSEIIVTVNYGFLSGTSGNNFSSYKNVSTDVLNPASDTTAATATNDDYRYYPFSASSFGDENFVDSFVLHDYHWYIYDFQYNDDFEPYDSDSRTGTYLYWGAVSASTNNTAYTIVLDTSESGTTGSKSSGNNTYYYSKKEKSDLEGAASDAKKRSEMEGKYVIDLYVVDATQP